MESVVPVFFRCRDEFHIQSCALDAPEDSEEVDEDGYGAGRYHHVGWPGKRDVSTGVVDAREKREARTRVA